MSEDRNRSADRPFAVALTLSGGPLRVRFFDDLPVVLHESASGRGHAAPRADEVANPTGIGRIVTADLPQQDLGGQRFSQGPESEIERPEAVQLGRRHHWPNAGSIAKHDCRPDRHGLQSRPADREDEVVGAENLLWVVGGVADAASEDVQRDIQPAARFTNGRQLDLGGRVVAEDERSGRASRQFGPRSERIQVHAIGPYAGQSGGGPHAQQALRAHLADPEVAPDGRHGHRSAPRVGRIVAHEHGGNAWESKQRATHERAVVAVDDVRPYGNPPEIVNDLDPSGHQRAAAVPVEPGVNDRPMALPRQLEGQVARTHHGPAGPAHVPVGNEYSQSHGRGPRSGRLGVSYYTGSGTPRPRASRAYRRATFTSALSCDRTYEPNRPAKIAVPTTRPPTPWMVVATIWVGSAAIAPMTTNLLNRTQDMETKREQTIAVTAKAANDPMMKAAPAPGRPSNFSAGTNGSRARAEEVPAR